MWKSGLVFVLLSFCPLAFGQLDSNSITVSVSQNASLQPDQAIFAVSVQSSITTGFDDVLAALQGSGITAANFSGLSTQQGTVGATTLPGGQLPPVMLVWTFSLPVPLANTKATVASLTTLQQTIANLNSGLTLSFSIVGTEISQQLAQSQTCSLSGLIATATTQAQALATAGSLTLGSILAMSSSTSNVISSPTSIFVSGSFTSASIGTTVPAPCAITVKFNVTRY